MYNATRKKLVVEILRVDFRWNWLRIIAMVGFLIIVFNLKGFIAKELIN
jgi:hypothetical protein